MTLAILCSGQGHQHRDMFALTGDAPAAAAIFASAEAALGGHDPRHLVRAQDDAALHANGLGQVLCCTQALAAFAALRETIGARLVLAGYSVGEMASWGCAGLFSATATLDLARQRAAAMDAAGGPAEGLAFVRGLGRRDLEAMCGRHAAAIAIVNPGDLFVIGGETAALQALCDEAVAGGAARAGLLKVAVASHTRRLAAAVAPFRAALAASEPGSRLAPHLRLFSGVDGAPVLRIETGLDKLAAQLAQPIDWDACLTSCIEAGVTTVLELGPGNALATMTASACPTIDARALEDFRTLDGVRSWLNAAPSR